MLALRLRFHDIASQLRVLAFFAEDLNAKRLLAVAKKFQNHRLSSANDKRLDLTDVYVLWEVLGIDAVLTLENAEGKSIRVGVSFASDEHKSRNRYYQVQRGNGKEMLQELGIEQYWIFIVTIRKFPQSKEEWIDILYSEIDTVTQTFCRVIQL